MIRKNNNMFLDSILLYVDPGSLSIVAAAIIGAIAGIGMTLKLYYYKIKEKFSKDKLE
jgi:hypothetical protein